MRNEQIIETLLDWNFWERDIETGLPREEYGRQLQRYLKTDEAVAVTGIRRSGKSTILLQMLADLIKNKVPRKNTLYVNFEDPQFYNFLGLPLLDQIWQAYQDYLEPVGPVYLVLDEIQKVKGWEHWVRSRYDRKENVKIFVTGSNADLLASEFSGVLTGRHFELVVRPLSFAEFLKFKGQEIPANKLAFLKERRPLMRAAQTYLETGGFPKAVLTQDDRLRKELLGQYFNDILTKDVAERYHVRDTGKLKSLALYYSSNMTRALSFNKIRKVAELFLSLDSIHRFSHYLENSFLMSLLPKFSYSLKNQMQAQRKTYFIDNGMHHAVAFKFSSDRGQLLENAVFQELKRRGKDTYYFSEKQEVDFVIKEGLKMRELINVCHELADKETRLRETASLMEGMRYFKLKEATIIVTEGKGEDILEMGHRIKVVPFYQWALEQK